MDRKGNRVKLIKGDFCELNKAFRQTNRSTFGVGQVVEVDGDEAVVRWLTHSRRELRDEAQRVEQLPTCYLRRIKPGLAALFQALLSASTKGRTPRNTPVDLRRAAQYAANRAVLEYFGLRGYRLTVAATKLTDRCLAYEGAGCVGDDRVNVGELLA